MAEIPGIYGLGFERRLVDAHGANLYDPEVLREVVAASGVWNDGTDYWGGFDPRNDGKHYVDSHETGPDNAHLGNNGAYGTATPETRSLRQLIRYTRAADAQAVSAIQTYIRQGSETHSSKELSKSRRKIGPIFAPRAYLCSRFAPIRNAVYY